MISYYMRNQIRMIPKNLCKKKKNRNKLIDFKTNLMVTLSQTIEGREELGGWESHIHTTV